MYCFILFIFFSVFFYLLLYLSCYFGVILIPRFLHSYNVHYMDIEIMLFSFLLYRNGTNIRLKLMNHINLMYCYFTWCHFVMSIMCVILYESRFSPLKLVLYDHESVCEISHICLVFSAIKNTKNAGMLLAPHCHPV